MKQPVHAFDKSKSQYFDHMSELPPFWVTPFGLLTGFMCTSFLTHWIQILFVAIGKDPRSPPIPGSRTSAVVVAIIHPVPWLLIIGIPMVILHALAEPPSEEWLWFVGSAVMSVVALFGYGLFFLYKQKKSAKNIGQPTESSS